MMSRWIVAAILLLSVGAHAAPPPPDSPDARIMHGFEEWIRGQSGTGGRNCCDVSDGRPLDPSELRVTDGHYQLLYARRHWADGTDQWIDVPASALLRQISPAGYAIAWVNRGRVDCLALAGAV